MDDDEYRYCPECETEYYAHIESCADCGVHLKTDSEFKELKHRDSKAIDEKTSSAVAIKEGDVSWIQELYNHLEKKGFTCKVIRSSACEPGQCGETFQLVVPAGDADDAALCLQEYNHKLHPELEESFDNIQEGKCPACSHEVGFEATECPECGLLLVIETAE